MVILLISRKGDEIIEINEIFNDKIMNSTSIIEIRNNWGHFTACYLLRTNLLFHFYCFGCFFSFFFLYLRIEHVLLWYTRVCAGLVRWSISNTRPGAIGIAPCKSPFNKRSRIIIIHENNNNSNGIKENRELTNYCTISGRRWSE